VTGLIRLELPSNVFLWARRRLTAVPSLTIIGRAESPHVATVVNDPSYLTHTEQRLREIPSRAQPQQAERNAKTAVAVNKMRGWTGAPMNLPLN
jgi:hypothetical protein